MVSYDIANKKILEIGCGLGITSLMLNLRSAAITSTDYHPEAQNFLNANTKLNNSKKIPFFLANWHSENLRTQKYDLIIGSDVLYEQEHSELIANFIEFHAEAEADVIIVDPGRGHLNKFTRRMKELTYTYVQKKPIDQGFLKQHFKGTINHYKRRN